MGLKTNQVVAYRATNVVNGKSYLGVTKSGLAYRERQHRREANLGRGYMLHNAMRKYGHENIVFEQLADFDGDYELALAYEVEAIAKYRPEYNITNGGEGFIGPRTVVFTAQHRANLSKAGKGKKKTYRQVFTPERREKVRLANLGKHPHWVGRKHTDETKAKIKAAGLKRVRPELWVKVKCLNDGRVFAHAGEAAAFYGVQRAWLRMCINRGRAMGSGLQFVDVKDSEE